MVGRGPRISWLDFGGDLDHGLDPMFLDRDLDPGFFKGFLFTGTSVIPIDSHR